MKLYSGDVKLAATVYVKADSAEEAQQKIVALHGQFIELSSKRQTIGDGLEMTGETFSKDMPDISLSPAMTIKECPTLPAVWVADDLEDEQEPS